MNFSNSDLIKLREKGIQKIELGQKTYISKQDFEEKSDGLRLYISGIDDLVKYVKFEQNLEIQQLAKQKIKGFMQNAENMKMELNQQGKFMSQVPFKQQNLQNTNKLANNIVQNQQQQQQQQQQKEQGSIGKFFSFFKKKPEPVQNQQQQQQKIPMLQQQQESTVQQDNQNMIVKQNSANQVKWDDIAGLEKAKESLKEAVILPIKFPNLFTGNRTPWKGILMYGPPGTGKTFLAKACAYECGATFFSLSSADIMSKYVGESEKKLKSIFEDARKNKPSIIFIDEIDSLASNREGGQSGGGSSNNESANRLKTQFLIEMQGVNGNSSDGVLVLGATNLPWSLDPAVRRRFEKRIYISLPDYNARLKLIKNLMLTTPHTLKTKDFESIAKKTENFSGADMSILVREACFQPVRLLQTSKRFKKVKDKKGQYKFTPCDQNDKKGQDMDFMSLNQDNILIPDISKEDFVKSLSRIKPSVGQEDLVKHVEFTKQFGEDG